MNKTIISTFLSVTLLFQSVNAGGGLSKPLKIVGGVFAGAVTGFFNGGPVGAAVGGVIGGAGAAGMGGQRGVHMQVPMGVTDHGLETPYAAEQRTRNQHFSNYIRARGIRPESVTTEIRQIYDETYGRQSTEELVSQMIINRIVNPPNDEVEEFPQFPREMQERMLSYMRENTPQRQQSFIDIFNARIAAARLSGELPPENFMDQYEWLFSERREHNHSESTFFSTISETSSSIGDRVRHAPSFSMAGRSNALSSGNDIISGMRTLGACSFQDRTGLVQDFMLLQVELGGHLSPTEMRFTYPSAWEYERRNVHGLPLEMEDIEVAARLRETAALMDLEDCRSPEEVLAYLDRRCASTVAEPTEAEDPLSAFMFDASVRRVEREHQVELAREEAGRQAVEEYQRSVSGLQQSASSLIIDADRPIVTINIPITPEDTRRARERGVAAFDDNLRREETIRQCEARASELAFHGHGYADYLEFVDSGDGILVRNPESRDEFNSFERRQERVRQDLLRQHGLADVQAHDFIPFVGPAINFVAGDPNALAHLGLDAAFFGAPAVLRVGGRAVAAISRNIARTGEIIGSTLMADTRFISSFIDSIERNALTATEREVVRAVQRTLTSSTEERALAVAADGWFERTMNAAMRGERAPFSSGTTGGLNRWLMDTEFPANMHPANDFFVPPSTNFTRIAVGADELVAFQRELDAARTALETEGPVVRSNPFEALMSSSRNELGNVGRGTVGELLSREISTIEQRTSLIGFSNSEIIRLHNLSRNYFLEGEGLISRLRDAEIPEEIIARIDTSIIGTTLSDVGNSRVMVFAEQVNSKPIIEGRIDCSKKLLGIDKTGKKWFLETFFDDLKNFESGTSSLHNGLLTEDLCLVSYYNSASIRRTHNWWTHVEVRNRMRIIDDVMQHLALPPDWGVRNTLDIILIPAGTDVTFISGKALEQVSRMSGELFMGRGFQVRLRDYDPLWKLTTIGLGGI